MEHASKYSDEDITLLKILSKLLKKGIVGYEYLEINKAPYKSFITTSIGDTRLKNAKPYRKPIFETLI